MAMELKKNLRLTHTLVITPQLQQAIKLLQLYRMELLETVREDMETNPLLEQHDETYEGNHTNKVAERYETRVLPFFSRELVFE